MGSTASGNTTESAGGVVLGAVKLDLSSSTSGSGSVLHLLLDFSGLDVSRVDGLVDLVLGLGLELLAVGGSEETHEGWKKKKNWSQFAVALVVPSTHFARGRLEKEEARQNGQDYR